MSKDYADLPLGLPVPQDDGAASHLLGRRLPDIALPSTLGGRSTPALSPGRVVIYVYPRTSIPGEELLKDWDIIPGARGCTPQAYSFRDNHDDLRSAGAGAIFGLSVQDATHQLEVATRLKLPFALLSDSEFKFTSALNLPTFRIAGMQLLKRLTIIARDGVIEHMFYPIFPPDNSASEVLSWLKSRRH